MSDQPTFTLDGRVALVTGASRGIGLAVARGLARRGATVLMVARDTERLHAAAAQLLDEGLDVTAEPVDLTDAPAVRGLPARLGPLRVVDVLVNAAGVMSEQMSKTLRTTDEHWRAVLDLNLNGAFTLTSTFVPSMVARRTGRVIHLSACLGRMSGPGTSGGLAPYRISKAALNAMVKNLASEVGSGRRGVFVDAVCPGHCRTDMGGPDAPRSAEQGADTVLWLAGRTDGPTGLLWEDRQIIPW